MTKHGYFHWNELMTNDVEAAKSFYAEALGWSYNSMQMGEGPTYWIIVDGEAPIGGMFEMAGPDFEDEPDHWMAYISVDDIDDRLARAKAGGATIKREPFDVEGVGRIALLQQPGGAAIGWMTPAS